MTNTWPLEYIDELHEKLSNALLDELTRLKAPQYAFELFYGIDFIYVYRREKMSNGHSLNNLEKDLTSFIQSSIKALIDMTETFDETGGSGFDVIPDLSTKSSDFEAAQSGEGRANLSPEMKTLCFEWVKRPAIPSRNMQDFLVNHQGRDGLPNFISTTTFKRALQLLGKAGKIRKGETGRWEQT